MAERIPRSWWVAGWGSVRLRTTILATVVVAIALAIGAVVFIGIVERSLTNEVLASVRMRAADLRIMAEAGTLPTRIVTEEADDEFIQVVDSNGEVVASGPDLRGAPRLAPLDAGEWTVTGVPNDDERFLAYAVAAHSGPDDIQIILGRTLEPVAEATALVAGLLAVGLPLMLGFVALTTWLVVGRALRPVERMRREVAGISARELDRRLDTPAADDEIGRLARTMNGMLDRLEASQARQRQFVADTSHELRSPIASIRQQAEVALAHPDRVEIRPMADSVLADSLRLQGLVDDLLLLARADERILDLQARAVDLDDIVFAEAAHRRSSPGRVGIDLAGVTAVRVLGDERALRCVVGNLLDNAVRHATTRVAVSLQQSDGTGVFQVDDDGPGVPEAERSRVFERFVRLDEARARHSGGVGLGLAIVSELLLVLGGHVRVLDSPLGGARFEVRMPTGFSEGSGTAP